MTAPSAAATPALGLDAGSLRHDYKRHLSYTLGRDRETSNAYRYLALALALRDRLMERWKATHAAYYSQDCRRTYYLSMEYLMGRTMQNAALNLGIDDSVAKVFQDLGVELEDLYEQEPDAALGNGGLGRLAACFIDSCATMRLPVMGYGLHYEYGMFRQRIVNGQQVEEPDHWLVHGNPWELERPEYAQRVQFGGRTEQYTDHTGNWRIRWVGTDDVLAVPYDVPVPGYENGTVNTLRLWRATSTHEFNLAEFNAGDYAQAIAAKNQAENISMVLYPNDKSENGKELRLRQQYFLASASLKDAIRRWHRYHEGFDGFADKNCFQLNDTHPTIAVAELMRTLIDKYECNWDTAWGITTQTMAYTNHTLLPEALEKWPVELVQRLLPRVMEIIYEINARFMRKVANKWPMDRARQARMSIIEDGRYPQVRMAQLAIVSSFSVNGVAQLHSDLLCAGLFKDFYELWPQKFNNKTNGITQRRWVAACNPELTELITSRIGDAWISDLPKLKQLEEHLDDADFRQQWQSVKQLKKQHLAELIKAECGVTVNPEAMFDVQVKRIHEYKRQLLNALHLIHLYDRIKSGHGEGMTPRVSIFGGKAAPGYAMAKQTIKLINNIAEVINNDSDVGDLLKVVFIPNYRVSLAEVIIPGTDLSEQISTAGKEASGTGNMKFMLNGALTIGTLDGANIEIREEVGEDDFFLFGLTAPEVEQQRKHYDPQVIIDTDEDLKRVIQLLECGHFNQVEPGIFDEIINSLTAWGDYWMTCADFRAYLDAQAKAAAAYQDRKWWLRASIRNSACAGKFSSDRTISEYNREIWKLEPVEAFPVS